LTKAVKPVAAVAVHLPFSVAQGDSSTAGIPQFVHGRVYDLNSRNPNVDSEMGKKLLPRRRHLADDIDHNVAPDRLRGVTPPLNLGVTVPWSLLSGLETVGDASEVSGPVMVACEYESFHWSPLLGTTGPTQQHQVIYTLLAVEWW
jgi:hypothetical protein